MTDKDIKDYCKNCKVEPPAMKFKCPECEHNPDNENNLAKDINVPHKGQIIIDGVDVSGCLFYQSNFEEDYDVRIKHFCSNWHNSCESSNNSNCYFKQLARKTQELYCAKNEIHSKTEYIQEQRDIIEQLTQESEELKEKIKAYENLALHIKCPHCNQELRVILNGIEEYTKMMKKLEEYEKPGGIIDEGIAWKGQADRYRKALEEIEGYVKTTIRMPLERKLILDIISRSKDC